VTAASGLRHCDLNDLWQADERPSNLSYNHRINWMYIGIVFNFNRGESAKGFINGPGKQFAVYLTRSSADADKSARRV